MKKSLALIAFASIAVTGCTNDPQTNREIECAGGILGGAAVGGLIGNQVGSGQGNRVATAVGAGAGAGVGTQLPACQ
jgi:outer membrane lipoprotein SlyB